MADLAPIIEGVVFDRGFVVNGSTRPFHSFTQPDQDANWSDHMDHFISEASKDHFIDRYNRSIALDGIRPALRPDARFIDIGCSSGYMLEEVHAAYPDVRVFGSDYFAAGLVRCHAMLPTIPLLQMDITDCKLPNDAFDAMTCL
ncbi:MAG TPA: class I SAM-dependent methyltransferase, partial [Polyangiaceae bacterium]|nr:class I SAM-dependent methyltransferase [Polyangiaceae bacterium]